MNADILYDIFQDHAALCQVQAEGESQPRAIRLVLQGRSTGTIRAGALTFLDNTTLPRGADWEYGLMLAADAPPGMNPETRLSVSEPATGTVLACEAAEAVYDLDPDTRERSVVAWRLALRGKQRMARGR